MGEIENKRNMTQHFDPNRVAKMAYDLIEQIEIENRRGKDIRDLPAFKTLKKMCGDENFVIANTGLTSLQHLVHSKILKSSQATSILISMFPSVTNHSLIVDMIGKLCPFYKSQDLSLVPEENRSYNMNDPQHPLITVLKHDKDKFWPMVFNSIQYGICNEGLLWTNSLNPIFRFIFSDPTGNPAHKTELLSLLLTDHCISESFMFGSNIQYPIKFKCVQRFILEALAMQKIDMTYCQMLVKINNYLLSNLKTKYIPFVSALTPFFALAIRWLIKNGHNPMIWIKQIQLNLDINSDSLSLVLLILTDVIQESTVPYVNEIISVCSWDLFHRSCHKLSAYAFASACLKWLIHPTSFGDLKEFPARPLSFGLNDLMSFLNIENFEWKDSTLELFKNENFDFLRNSQPFVKLNANILKMLLEWGNETDLMLRDIGKREVSVQKYFYWVVSGIVLCDDRKDVVGLSLDILGNVVKVYPDLSHSLCSLLLYKLSKEKEPFLQLKYLLMFLELPVDTAEVPVIIRIMESFTEQSNQVITPIAMRLYLALWKTEPRIYPYLLKMLNVPCQIINEKDREINIAKASTMREICKFKPEAYGKDLVPLLSNILNTCCDNTGTSSALAIEAITELLKAHVIDVGGTWKALRPKLTRDNRRAVKISLCKMFGVIPSLKTGDNEEFVQEAIITLWGFMLGGDVPVAKAATEALSKFPLEFFKLRLIPEEFRENFDFLKNEETAKKPEDVLAYVPGACWVQFLKKINPEILADAENFLIELVDWELESFPRGIFYLYPGKPEPLNYSYLPHRSIIRAMVESVKKFSESDSKPSEFIKSCLRVLNHEYSKLLPPLNWSFLENLGKDYWKECLGLTAKQATVSVTAKYLTENWVKGLELEEEEDVVFLYSILTRICDSVQPNTLRQVVDKTLRLTLEPSLKGEGTLGCFEFLLERIKEALLKDGSEKNKEVLAGQLENILPSIPPRHKIMKKYAECAVAFPEKFIDKITSPSSWWQVTPDKIEQAVIINSAIATYKKDVIMPLAKLNECIDVVGTMPEQRSFTLLEVLKVIQNKRSDASHCRWILDLMGRIQSAVFSESSQLCQPSEAINARPLSDEEFGRQQYEEMRRNELAGEVPIFLIDMFMCSCIVLVGYDCFIKSTDDIITDSSVRFWLFPTALHDLLNLPKWKEIAPQVLEWLHKLSKWKRLLAYPSYRKILEQSISALKTLDYCSKDSKWQQLFDFKTF